MRGVDFFNKISDQIDSAVTGCCGPQTALLLRNSCCGKSTSVGSFSKRRDGRVRNEVNALCNRAIAGTKPLLTIDELCITPDFCEEPECLSLGFFVWDLER
jgi:hypothetical protein